MDEILRVLERGDSESVAKFSRKWDENSKKEKQVIAGGAVATGAAAPFTPTKLDTPKSATSSNVKAGQTKVSDLRGVAVGDGVRVNGEAQSAKLAQSIGSKSGYRQNNPIVVGRYKNGEKVINEGHHRLRAAEMLGIDELPTKIVDIDRKKPSNIVPWALRGKYRKKIKDARKSNPQLSADEISRVASKKTGAIGSLYNKLSSSVDVGAALKRTKGGTGVIAAAGGVGVAGAAVAAHRKKEIHKSRYKGAYKPISSLDPNQLASLRGTLKASKTARTSVKVDRVQAKYRRAKAEAQRSQRGADAAKSFEHRSHGRRYRRRTSRKGPGVDPKYPQKYENIGGAKPQKSRYEKAETRRANKEEKILNLSDKDWENYHAPTGKKMRLTPSYAAQFAVPGAAGAGGLGYVHHRKKKMAVSKADKDRATNAAIGTAAGGAATYGAYTGGGYAAKKALKHKRDTAPFASRIRAGSAWEAFQRKEGFKDLKDLGSKQKRAEVMQRYPKEIPGWRGQRVLAFKNRPKVRAAAYAAGAVAGGAYGYKKQKDK